MMNWLTGNKEWLFSGAGLVLLMGISRVLYAKMKGENPKLPNLPENQPKDIEIPLAKRKSTTHILFIDDDTKFKVVKILSQSGWTNTSIIKDAKTLEEPPIANADILFVDVQGVGIAMGFVSEGLGLAQALKEKYPRKKIVIYSAETQGNRFHTALREADSFLPKNADPYEFQKIVEELSAEICR